MNYSRGCLLPRHGETEFLIMDQKVRGCWIVPQDEEVVVVRGL